MIALALAAILTITALAIWAKRTIRRPIDWSGPFTLGPPPPLSPLTALALAFNEAAEIIRQRSAEAARALNLNKALRASERDDQRREGQ